MVVLLFARLILREIVVFTASEIYIEKPTEHVTPNT